MASKKAARFIASCGGLGYSRYAPGTVASAVAMVAYFLVSLVCVWQLLCIATLVLLVAGWLASATVISAPTDDPSWVVIDEWVAVWLMCLFIPYSFISYAIALVAFRMLDIAKPWPISRIQALPGAWGIFADDLLAAFLARCAVSWLLNLLLIGFFLSFPLNLTASSNALKSSAQVVVASSGLSVVSLALYKMSLKQQMHSARQKKDFRKIVELSNSLKKLDRWLFYSGSLGVVGVLTYFLTKNNDRAKDVKAAPEPAAVSGMNSEAASARVPGASTEPQDVGIEQYLATRFDLEKMKRSKQERLTKVRQFIDSVSGRLNQSPISDSFSKWFIDDSSPGRTFDELGLLYKPSEELGLVEYRKMIDHVAISLKQKEKLNYSFAQEQDFLNRIYVGRESALRFTEKDGDLNVARKNKKFNTSAGNLVLIAVDNTNDSSCVGHSLLFGFSGALYAGVFASRFLRAYSENNNFNDTADVIKIYNGTAAYDVGPMSQAIANFCGRPVFVWQCLPVAVSDWATVKIEPYNHRRKIYGLSQKNIFLPHRGLQFPLELGVHLVVFFWSGGGGHCEVLAQQDRFDKKDWLFRANYCAAALVLNNFVEIVTALRTDKANAETSVLSEHAFSIDLHARIEACYQSLVSAYVDPLVCLNNSVKQNLELIRAAASVAFNDLQKLIADSVDYLITYIEQQEECDLDQFRRLLLWEPFLFHYKWFLLLYDQDLLASFARRLWCFIAGKRLDKSLHECDYAKQKVFFDDEGFPVMIIQEDCYKYHTSSVVFATGGGGHNVNWGLGLPGDNVREKITEGVLEKALQSQVASLSDEKGLSACVWQQYDLLNARTQKSSVYPQEYSDYHFRYDFVLEDSVLIKSCSAVYSPELPAFLLQ